MGSPRKWSPCNESLSSQVGSSGSLSVTSSPSWNAVSTTWTQTQNLGGVRLDRKHAKCTTSRSHNSSSNYFSIGNGLILILLLLYWTCTVHGGYPGRGPPGPHHRGPPLLPHHPLGGGRGPPRTDRFGRRPPPNTPPRRSQNGQSDLAVAAQTLYDLRGYSHNVPLSGPETPRFHRQNDPFTLPTPLASNQRGRGGHQDTRTAPLVFPSFYQEQPTPAPSRSSIFGHNQHLSQTRFEPPSGFHLGGNSASGKITFEQQSAPSSRDPFRPSQIDISLHNNQVQVTPVPGQLVPQHQPPQNGVPDKKNIPNTRASSSTHDSRTRAPKLTKNQQQDPFVYVYDEVDYDEGEDDFPIGGRGAQRAPQGQINSNRITPATSTTTAPLRSREPSIVPSVNPFHHQPQYHNPPHIYSTTTQPQTKQSTTTQNSLFYGSQKDEFLSDPGRDNFFRDHGIIRPPVTPTPRPNVEIVPSSERKPPPDQSNLITRLNPGRDYSRQVQPQVPVVSDNDLRPRRPVPTSSTTTTTPSPPLPPSPSGIPPQFQREAIFPQHQQGRQVGPPSPVPYFPPGLDRRPFETNNNNDNIPKSQQDRTRNHFDQVVNLLQEEEEEDEFPQNNALNGPSLFEQGFNNPSKLRPVNTIIPKNRIPKEDILLPPNFPFGQEITTALTPLRDDVTRLRGDPTQQRVRDNTVTRIREELPQRAVNEDFPQRVIPQRVVPTQPQVRTRPPLVIRDEEEEEARDNAGNLPPHTRVREQTLRQQSTRTTTTTTTTEAPVRSRTVLPRQRLRPNYRLTTTTSPTTSTTPTSTTPAPTYVEYPSQEYVDDYDNPPPQYQSPAPPQLVTPAPPKSLRFPPFPKKDTSQEFPTTSIAPPPQRQRPSQINNVSQERPNRRPGKGQRFRETTTADTPTSPRTTGKPLYTTGKMLSKEGGLYAGQQITSSHVYGSPVPNMPINSVLDKVPGVLDGKVILATTKPSFGSPQKHLRSKQRNPEHGPPSRINPSSHRLRPHPTARPQQENSLDIVETVTLRPYQDERTKGVDEPKRLRPGSQFVRGQLNSNERNPDGQAVLPRRRKVRPGQRRQQTTPLPPDPFTETVSIHPREDEENAAFQTNRAQVIREQVTPNSLETTTPVAQLTPSPRSRRPRPRPGKLNQNVPDASNTSERSQEPEDSLADDQPQKQVKPVRKLRPRLRPVPVGQLNAQQQRGAPSEVVTQSSAQVDRKPTDPPGRFSSRFREESFGTTTASSPTQSLRGDGEERESSPSRFSPPSARPTFKPPQPKKTPPKRKPQQATTAEDDALPDSIRLSPKDVIANRKPARRIPPGSASDRLKALQQRRKKVFGSGEEPEQAEEGRQVPVSKRPRKPFFPQEKQDEQPEQVPQPQRLRLRQHVQEPEEASGSKREVIHRPGLNGRNELDYYNEENKDDAENDREDYEYGNDEVTSPSPQPQPHFVTNRPPRLGQGFHRNRSLEVTSDEARSVLGIPRPAAPYRPPRKQRLKAFQDEQIEQEQRPRLRQRSREEQQPNNQPFRVKQHREEVRQRARPVPQDDREEEDDDEVQHNPEYEDEEDNNEEVREQQTPRKIQQLSYESSTTSVAPTTIARKKVSTPLSRSRQPEPEDEDDDEVDDEERHPERTTVTTSTSTSSTSTASPTDETPPAAPQIRAGPLPIKQGVLKARLRPNRRLQGGGNGGGGTQPQPRVSVSQSSTSTTETTTSGLDRKPHGLKHGTIHVSKSPRPRLSSLSGKRKERKFVEMSTDNPSLPLESIFPEVS